MADLPAEGSVDRPFRENPPRWLKEVHWSGGLAVHFDAMSYLSLPQGIPEFSQAVISLWFRVPQSSVDAASGFARGIFDNMIPLITFGRPQILRIMTPIIQDVAVWVDFPDTGEIHEMGIVGYTYQGDVPADPSFIGVDCGQNPQGGSAGMPPRLTFNLQMANYATGSSLTLARSRVEYRNPPPGPPVIGDSYENLRYTTLTDYTSQADLNRPEYFLVQSPITVAPDKWHHLLLSFDLRTPVVAHGPPQTLAPGGSSYDNTAQGTESVVHLWYAIDDVNYQSTGPDWANFAPYAVDGLADPNAITTDLAWRAANTDTGLPFDVPESPAQYSWQPEPVPSGGAELGIPASSQYVNQIHPVEMAELQFFTGVSFDTADTAKRRAFVDAEGKPVAPADAIKLLGKLPTIVLHGTRNWIKGQGGIALGNDPLTGRPVIVAPLQFTPTGKITAYTPEPKLGA